MAKDILNLSGSIGINRFQIVTSTPTLSSNYQQLVLPYIGYGNPALVANLTTYEYSLDGSSWSVMTAAVGTVLTSLDFTPDGEDLIFTWEIKTDITTSIYNKNIYIRFQALSGSLLTNMSNRSVYFPKIVSNEVTLRNANRLPEDYVGINGSDLLEKAPKS